MSIEGVQISDYTSKGDEECSIDQEKLQTHQNRVNHSKHYYGSSLQDCHQATKDNIDFSVKVKENTTRHSPSKKNFVATLFLCFFLGGLGMHRFYAGKPLTGILMLCTFGGLGLWAFIDFWMIVFGAFEDGEGNPIVHKI